MAKWSVMLAQSLVLLVYSKFHSEISTIYSRLQVFSRLEFIPCKTWLMLNLNLNFVLSLATVKSIILPQSPFRAVHISDLIFWGRALTEYKNSKNTAQGLVDHCSVTQHFEFWSLTIAWDSSNKRTFFAVYPGVLLKRPEMTVWRSIFRPPSWAYFWDAWIKEFHSANRGEEISCQTKSLNCWKIEWSSEHEDTRTCAMCSFFFGQSFAEMGHLSKFCVAVKELLSYGKFGHRQLREIAALVNNLASVVLKQREKSFFLGFVQSYKFWMSWSYFLF